MNKAKPTILRWPEWLRQAVVDAAASNRRSMNSEILVRLERDFAREVVELGADQGAAA